MTVRISRGLLDRILAEAAADPEREVCGLLLGVPRLSVRAERSRGTRYERAVRDASFDYARDERVIQVVPTRNVAPDPALSFEVDPAALFTAIRAERGGGARLIGHYHSHPGGSPAPSPR
ncbi:MAG TPA: Mov34/MPN/PAD-1 family protein, partial [Sphingomonas sp.]|nr:Mov34/MPN/PAD-1 family protein [Sphingomonas sp.]